jgi:DNA-binding GntR family transcriptional regulator
MQSSPSDSLSKQIEMHDSSSSLLLRDIAYERIKDAIRTAEVAPGQPLSETGLSKMLGISRTPVREALQVLAQEGLVQIIPGRAVTVAAPSLNEVMDAIHIRYLLEPEVVRLATKALSNDQMEILREAAAGLEEAIALDDRAAWSANDNVFHVTLSNACPNQLLGELSLQIRNRISYLSIDSKDDIDRLAISAAEHRMIVEKLSVGDAEGAKAAMEHHIRMLRNRIFRRLSHSY